MIRTRSFNASSIQYSRQPREMFCLNKKIENIQGSYLSDFPIVFPAKVQVTVGGGSPVTSASILRK